MSLFRHLLMLGNVGAAFPVFRLSTFCPLGRDIMLGITTQSGVEIIPPLGAYG